MIEPHDDGVRRIEGAISNLKRSRRRRDFVMSEIGGGTGATAVTAALSGMGGMAVGAASIDSSEEADYVEFDLDGHATRGWFWRFPFSEGDRLEVVCESSSKGWVAYGARRPGDGCVAIYPHCYEGVKSHYRSNARFWSWVILVIYLVTALMMAIAGLFADGPVQWGQLGIGAVLFGLPAFVLVFGFLAYRATRKTIGFPRMAERIFKGFGWPDPTNINLRLTSRAQRREGDSSEYGYFFFRY